MSNVRKVSYLEQRYDTNPDTDLIKYEKKAPAFPSADSVEFDQAYADSHTELAIFEKNAYTDSDADSIESGRDWSHQFERIPSDIFEFEMDDMAGTHTPRTPRTSLRASMFSDTKQHPTVTSKTKRKSVDKMHEETIQLAYQAYEVIPANMITTPPRTQSRLENHAPNQTQAPSDLFFAGDKEEAHDDRKTFKKYHPKRICDREGIFHMSGITFNDDQTKKYTADHKYHMG